MLMSYFAKIQTDKRWMHVSHNMYIICVYIYLKNLLKLKKRGFF